MIDNGFFRLPVAGTLLRDKDFYRYQKTVKAQDKKLDSKKPILKFKSQTFIPWILWVRLALGDGDRIDATHRVIDTAKLIGVSLHLSTYWLRYLTSVGITRCLRLLLAHQNFYEIHVMESRTRVVSFSAMLSLWRWSKNSLRIRRLETRNYCLPIFRNRTDWFNGEKRERAREIEEFHLTMLSISIKSTICTIIRIVSIPDMFWFITNPTSGGFTSASWTILIGVNRKSNYYKAAGPGARAV